MRRPRLRSLLATSVLVASLLTPSVLAAQDDATPVATTDAPLILAAVTGWDDATADALLQGGSLPALAAMVEQGSRGDLLSPGGMGPALTTILTGAWPSEHGVVGDTFFRTGSPDFADVATWTDPGVVQADTLPLAAERAGKFVAAVGWPGLDGEEAVLQGPVIGAPESFSLPGVARTGATADEIAAADASGAGLAPLDFAPAAGWANLPESFSEPQEAVFAVQTTDEAVNPERTVNVLAIDSTDDGATNYDQAVVAVEKDDDLASTVPLGGWGKASVTLEGDLAGATAGFAYKVLELAPDLSQVSVYLTPLSRLHAAWAGCEGEDACVAEGGFAESVNQQLGAVIAMDDAALRAGFIDQQTFAEQSAASLAQTQEALSYLTGDLGIQPDLLLLGAAVNPSGSAGSGVATPVAADSALAGDAGYAAVDALLGQAETALGGNANVILAALGSGVETSRAIDAGAVLAEAGLTEGVQPGNCVPAPVTMPEGTPDPEGLPVGPQLKACWNGQVAQIYVNVDGREAAGSVAEDALDALRDEIVAAFTAVQDPGSPGAGVVANVYRQGEARNVDGLDLLHPSRTGDVVVVLNAPYRFASNAKSGSSGWEGIGTKAVHRN